MISNPTPQRALRGHMPQRPTPRTATTAEHHTQLSGRLTERDRWLARMLYEHKVLTVHQIVELCFPGKRAANHRLLNLFKWRVVDRFQPFVSKGTAPMHYVLDHAGAMALAYEDGLDPRKIGYRHEDAMGIAHSLRLAHTVGTNGFFTSLIALSQRPGSDGQLTAWWSELRCMRLFGDMVRPDAYGRWREDDHEIEFFLEFDFGTEDLGTLSSKLHGYEKLATATGISTPVLLWLPTERREANARSALSTRLAQLDDPLLVPVATSAAEGHNPAGSKWLPVTTSSPRWPGRLRLAELAGLWPQAALPAAQVSNAATSGEPSTALAPPEPVPPPRPTSPFGGGA
ncbi:replication-relaxation family protein [Lentzea sp. NPDC102401]|uniref:replication-relaxation family protein n=1 Tax=Lentzea sp. NPDC102401 TaxID=3364128 RepID=UPI003820ED1B